MLFALLLIASGWGPIETVLDKAGHFAEVRTSGWEPTNVWLKSSECAQRQRVWLALCRDDGTLVAITQSALGDDLGHALLLDLWAIASDTPASLVDVAHLNIGLNILGFVVLASFLFATGSYIAAIALIILGPTIYFGWIGVSPHWSFIGITSIAALLPMAILARECRFLSRRLGIAYVALGIFGLAIAMLVREAVGVMGIVTTLVTIMLVVARRRCKGLQYRHLLVVGLLAFLSPVAPRIAPAARDVFFTVQPSGRMGRHGFSDILYMGLGAVPNSLGISYADDVAKRAAERIDPRVVYCSGRYFKIMWRLYFHTVASQPAEVMRIYLEKAKRILADRILDSAPPLAVVLSSALSLFLAATALGLWSRIGYSQGLLLGGAALVIICLFIVQAILATPDRLYSMPMGPALLMLTGVSAEFVARSALLLRAAEVRQSSRQSSPDGKE
ncbi:hypothetical protein [Enhydrobacter aerosaccus]|nr:hypothetical protein [Enhydrobacter aerosaccus]